MFDKLKYPEFYGTAMLVIAVVLFMIGMNEFVHTINLRKLLFSMGAIGLLPGFYLYRRFTEPQIPIHYKVRSFFLYVVSTVFAFSMIGYTGNARIIREQNIIRDIAIDTIIPVSIEYHNIESYKGPPDFLQVWYRKDGVQEEIRIYPKDFKCFDPYNVDLEEKVGLLWFKIISYLPPKDCND